MMIDHRSHVELVLLFRGFVMHSSCLIQDALNGMALDEGNAQVEPLHATVWLKMTIEWDAI